MLGLNSTHLFLNIMAWKLEWNELFPKCKIIIIILCFVTRDRNLEPFYFKVGTSYICPAQLTAVLRRRFVFHRKFRTEEKFFESKLIKCLIVFAVGCRLTWQ